MGSPNVAIDGMKYSNYFLYNLLNPYNITLKFITKHILFAINKNKSYVSNNILRGRNPCQPAITCEGGNFNVA